ncbi:hypothetical protein R3P38DRAFT_2806918 [Favolaschia claudopus]|uniref:Uncharacterized protein n=1 Tax=Favolaschia claudopus TaxID=2862362 RepID=A0AAV9ZJC3_9AGAR
MSKGELEELVAREDDEDEFRGRNLQFDGVNLDSDLEHRDEAAHNSEDDEDHPDDEEEAEQTVEYTSESPRRSSLNQRIIPTVIGFEVKSKKLPYLDRSPGKKDLSTKNLKIFAEDGKCFKNGGEGNKHKLVPRDFRRVIMNGSRTNENEQICTRLINIGVREIIDGQDFKNEGDEQHRNSQDFNVSEEEESGDEFDDLLT